MIDSKSLGSSSGVSVPRQVPSSSGGGGGGGGGSGGHHFAGSSIAASLGAAVGATPAAVAAAEQDTDFARLDLATGALAVWELGAEGVGGGELATLARCPFRRRRPPPPHARARSSPRAWKSP